MLHLSNHPQWHHSWEYLLNQTLQDIGLRPAGPQVPQAQGKASDNNNNNPDNNNDGTDNDEGLVPMKGGQGGHKACKQKNQENPTKQK